MKKLALLFITIFALTGCMETGIESGFCACEGCNKPPYNSTAYCVEHQSGCGPSPMNKTAHTFWLDYLYQGGVWYLTRPPGIFTECQIIDICLTPCGVLYNKSEVRVYARRVYPDSWIATELILYSEVWVAPVSWYLGEVNNGITYDVNSIYILTDPEAVPENSKIEMRVTVCK